MDWIEIVAGFGCNCRCRVCPSASQAQVPAMSAEEISGWLEQCRERGAKHVWFGGGEPSLYPDLVRSIERARELGYQRIRIQTNGIRFAYLPFTKRCLQAGANEFSLSIKGADADIHNQITQNPDSFGHLVQGARNLVAQGARVEGDILITTLSLPGLADAVERFAGLGLSRFTFWVASRFGMEEEGIEDLLPRMTDLAPHLESALEAAGRVGVEATSLHTPPCVLGERYRDYYVHAGTWKLSVITPGSEPFAAEDSPIEGGVYLESCADCEMRPDCLGLRKDYLDLFGPEEFNPIYKP
jgi:MoaA/NifB/PqqE/SkfB family radical SAM enzyme